MQVEFHQMVCATIVSLPYINKCHLIDTFVLVNVQLKRLKLRKNNWSSESYRFDDVFTESASQKRVYDAVAKPVVEVNNVILP